MISNRTIRLGKGLRHVALALEEGRLRLSVIGTYIGPPDTECPLWTLSLRTPEGATLDVSADAAGLGDVQRDTGSAAFTWMLSLGGSEAAVRVQVDTDTPGTPSLSLSATLPDGWSVAEAVFPLVRLSRTDDMRLATPTGWGIEREVTPGMELELVYPSWQSTMQFLALCGAAGGVYIGTHDPAANHKAFRARADGDSLTLEVAHFPAIGGSEYTLGYAISLGAFEGGYVDAANLYRPFALTAPWAQAGPVSRRPLPQWLIDTELWLKPGETPWTDDDAECIAATRANVEWCRKAAAFFDVPISLHWYRWHQIPYDTLYPEYFPAKAGFADGVKEAQADGFHVMPYINGRLCDPESKTWKSGGQDWAARDEQGNPYTEVYASEVPLNVMCPSTDGWRGTVSGLVKRLVDEIGVDGVYVDQIAAAKAERCFAMGHPHAPGGGHFWVDAYRRLIAEAHANLPSNGILTTEENMECWIDQFDALLVVNTPTNEGRLIPLFPVIYAGHAVTFGFQYIPKTEAVESVSFRAKMARAFLWGAQLGWVDAEKVMAPDAALSAEFLRALCHARRDAHDFLLYGQFLAPVEVYGDNPPVNVEAPGSFGGTYNLEIQAVMATLWRAEDGRTAVAICNLDDAVHTVQVSALEGAGPITLEAREARVIAV
ncbi:MAG TPA: DUF6259 domain-containing protein [Armatimonadota bacterium]|jgi:hypothetical protein